MPGISKSLNSTLIQYNKSYVGYLQQNCLSSQYCDSEKCSCLEEYDTFPSSNEEDGTSFCVCINGTANYRNCDNGKVYNATEGICELMEVGLNEVVIIVDS